MESEFRQNPEELEKLVRVYGHAGRLIRSRLLIQEADLSPKEIPFGGNKLAQEIAISLEETSKGFVLTSKAENYSKSQFIGLFRETLKNWNEGKGIAEPYIVSYRYALTTLAYLAQIKEVDFACFAEPVDNLDLEKDEFSLTFWPRNYSSEELWVTLSRIKNTTKEILWSRGRVNHDKLIFAGHFFAAGTQNL